MSSNVMKALSLAAGLLISGGAAHAATLTADGVLCEGPEALLPGDCDDGTIPRINDGPSNGDGPLVMVDLGVGDSGHIFGGVRGLERQYADNFTLDGPGTYKLTLTALGFRFQPEANGDPVFDATWNMGGNLIGTIGNIDGTESVLSTVLSLDGGSLFNLNAAGGQGTDGSIMEYKLEVSRVPLPAAAWMLLAGVGGLGVVARRKKNAA